MAARWHERKSSGYDGSKAIRFIIIFIIAIGVIFLAKNIMSYMNMKSQRDNMRVEIEELKKSNEELSAKVNNLYNDKEYIEKKAREKLNLIKDGETVIIIKKDK